VKCRGLEKNKGLNEDNVLQNANDKYITQVASYFSINLSSLNDEVQILK